MFSLLLPFTGLSAATVITGLVLYSLTILVRNILAGLDARRRRTSATRRWGWASGAGGCCGRSSCRSRCPRRSPGCGSPTVSTVALTTVGTIVGFGGLGDLITRGLQLDVPAPRCSPRPCCAWSWPSRRTCCCSWRRRPSRRGSAAGPADGLGRRRRRAGSRTPPTGRGPAASRRSFVEHLGLTAASLGLACLVALPLAVWLGHIGRGGVLAVQVANIGRAVPTLAILVILVLAPRPPFGLSVTSALVAFTLFAIPPILTNTYVGMREVDRGAVEAARGMGMTALAGAEPGRAAAGDTAADDRGTAGGGAARGDGRDRRDRRVRRARTDRHRAASPTRTSASSSRAP